MSYEVNSISISDLFWTKLIRNGISFSFKGLPDSIHITIAWNEKGNINLHITKNIGEENDKPKFVIARFDKQLMDEIMQFAPISMFNKIFQPVSFKRYSRKSRKNIRLFYLDDLEKSNNKKDIEEMVKVVWEQISTVNKKNLKIKKNCEKYFLPFVNSKNVRSVLLNNLKGLTSRSFDSKTIRGGMLLMGKKSYPLFSVNGRCYAAMKKMTIYELLISFVKPEFAQSLLDYINEALDRLADAQSLADTKFYNRPYHLYIEKAG